MTDVPEPQDGIRRLLPILTWLPPYDRAWLRGDLAAGIAVTALIVPKNLGYAGIAGVPLQNRDGVIDRIGAEHLHGDVERAVEAQLEAPPGR